LAQFATHDEFAARIGLTLTSDEQARADTLLTLASGLIQQEARQTVELVEDDVLAVPSIYGERFRLPQRPVVSISSVILTPHQQDPVTVDPAVYYLDKDELVRITSRLIFPELQFVHWSPGWLGPYWTITVTYTHGFATIPEVVKSVCMEAVVRAWVNPGSVARQTIGDTATVYDNMRFSPTGLLLTEDEKKNINDLLRRRSGSVTLR